ncbi:phosphatidylinositol-3,5-bisphosphate 5-phosphatase [Mortierella sp. AM989]|nr:phosphatidylinositol-3,5-bisphosphate 5-phosphatase [Mortierella sp. AM989]
MPAPRVAPTQSESNLTEFPTFTFPPPPAKPGNVVLNRFVLYETKTRYFIVGTNAPAGNRFRVLKIDRTTAPDELSITEDEGVYSKSEVDDLLEMIKAGSKSTGGMREIAKFYGIVGFVRFTEGYYITLITKRSPVALIGGHYIFHIDGTSTISIHSSTTPTSKLDKNSDEARYLQMFQMVDLSKNFYFSYSYDITRTLQWNMTRNSHVEGRNRMFVWNQYLLENGFSEQMMGIDNQWALPIMYGFVDQSKLSILGRNVFVTLIARRSRFFAGARFLKRGVNDRGFVANDVETEQIVSEMSTTSFYGASPLNANPNHTSFVQHRGSIPLYWTQDGTNMSPKPAIELNVIDPYFSAAGLHFDDMFKRYGAPCIVLNLIKAKEKTARESLLLKEFEECIEYLNQFLPEDKKIWHIKWDMSRASKSPNENVISVLEIIAEKTFAQTGFFHSGYKQDPTMRNRNNVVYGSGLQNGVVRTNCIDCLDRTNAAQFIIAKCALGHQLYSLGLISEPIVPFDCDLVNMLTEMYHDHGDTIALQYGGSHLVNTMETYRKINQWTSHSRDMIESIKRFYSNSFVDAEKQDAMNLFLGNYRVRKGAGPALWELPGDYHLHNTTDPELKKIRKSYIRWWTPDALLPQDVLAQKSFQQAENYDLDRFELHDGGFDDYDGPYEDEYEDEYRDKNYDRDQEDQDGAGSLGRDDSADRLDKYNLNLRQFSQGENQIEHLRSEDEEDYSGNIKSFGATGRIDSMDSIMSGKSGRSSSSQSAIASTESRRSSLNPSKLLNTHSMSSIKHESKDTFKQNPAEDSEVGIRTSQSNPSIVPSSQESENGAVTNGNSKSDRELTLDENMVDFKERIVAPPETNKDSRFSGSNLPKSSSSSVSSLRRYHQPHLRNSASRSSLATSIINEKARPGSSAYYSRGEKFDYDGFEACDDGDDDGESGLNGSAWSEYWEEYYRPKVQTSFQRLFAYNMNSTSRYMPPNIKNVAEQSPFEVRQNHSILTQAEINAKAAAKSEKPSMLSWLGLSSGSSKNNSNDNSGSKSSKAGSGYADGSKTLPLSTGRKKGMLYSLDEDVEFQGTNDHKDGISHHARGSRLSVASFPVTINQEYDEKTGAQQNQNQVDKTHVPVYVPRSKEEEWELTKNVWTNLPKFAIHDASFTPSSGNKSIAIGELPNKTPGAEGRGKDETTSGVVSPPSEVTPKSKGHLETLVERSLKAEVNPHQTKEYRKYAQQYKSIKLDSVPNRGSALLNAHARANQRDERSNGTSLNSTATTPIYGSVLQGLNTIHQQQQPENESVSVIAPPSSARPGMTSIKDLQNGGSSASTATIGTTELNEDEEYLYAVSRAGSGQKPRIQISTTNNSNMGDFPRSPVVVPPHAFGSSFTSTSPSAAVGGQHSEWNIKGTVTGRSPPEPYIPPSYLPGPPILLAPMTFTVKPPSQSELILLDAHVEYPKLTLETAGQASLNPYFGASSATRAKYDFYYLWTLGKRYSHMTAPYLANQSAAAAAAVAAATNPTAGGGGSGSGGGGDGVEREGKNPRQDIDNNSGSIKNEKGGVQQPPPLRRGSSTMYTIVGGDYDSQDADNLDGSRTAGMDNMPTGSTMAFGGVAKDMPSNGWKAAKA